MKAGQDLRSVSRAKAERILVTGGLGFLGSALVKRFLSRGHEVSIVDVGTYAADPRRIEEVDVPVFKVDVASGEISEAIRNFRPDVIVHAAAETHVTRSERAAESFFRTNVEGTERVLEAAAAHRTGLVIHVSTDEVYGPCPADPFKEHEKEPGEGRATSPYARSKALADDVAAAYSDKLPVIIVRPTNCFGPWQHPEKAIPRWIARALSGERLPVWGDGLYVRDWMYVDDLCSAIEKLVESGEAGKAYNAGPSAAPVTNLAIADAVGRLTGAAEGAVYLTNYDRPDHDRRYAVDSTRLRALGWSPRVKMEEGLALTVDWYRRHQEWWSAYRDEAESLYQDEADRNR